MNNITYLKSRKNKKYIQRSKTHAGSINNQIKSDNYNDSIINNCQKIKNDFENDVYNDEFKNLKNCNFDEITMISNKNFVDVDFSHTNLDGVIFKNVFFLNCKFHNSRLNKTDFSSCKFRGLDSKFIIGTPILPNDYKFWYGQILGPYIHLNSYNDMKNLNDSVYRLFIDNDLDYTGSDFSGIDLTQIFIERYYKNNSIFNYVNFSGADFTRIVFDCKSLTLVSSGKIIGVPKSMPKGYNLIKGYILGKDVNLTNADLSDTYLHNIDLSESIMTGIISGNIKGEPKLPYSYKLINGYIIGPDVNLSNVDLTDFDLSNMDLRYCELKNIISSNIKGLPLLPEGYKVIKNSILGPNVILNNIDFKDVDLSNLNLMNCNLKGVLSGNIKGNPILPYGYRLINGYILGIDVNLTNADLSGIDLSDIDLSNSTLDGLISKNVSGQPKLPIDYKIINGYIIGPNVNLKGADLQDLNISNIDLKRVKSGSIQGTPILPNLYKLINGFILGPDVDLTNCYLIDIDLNEIDLSNALLKGLVSENIKGSPILPSDYKLMNGYIIGPDVYLHNADLSNLNLKDLNLKGIKSDNISGEKVILPEDYILENGHIIGPYVELYDADLSNLDLYKVDLRGVKSRNIKGSPKLPTGLKIINGIIIGPDVNLDNVDFNGIELIDINLNNADLSNCNLNKIITKGIIGEPILPKEYTIQNGYIIGPGVDLSGADLKEMNFKGLNLNNVIFNQTNLDNTRFAINYITLTIHNQNPDELITYERIMSGNYYETDEIYNEFPIYKKELEKYNLIARYQKAHNNTRLSRWQIIMEKDKHNKEYIVNTDSGFAFSEYTNKNIYHQDQLYLYTEYKHSSKTGNVIMNVAISLNQYSSKLEGIVSKNIVGNPILPENYVLIKNCIIGPGANLKGVDLKNTDLSNIDLSNCDLRNADLTGAKLFNIKSMNILGIPKLPANYKIVNGYIVGPDVDLTGADLRNTDLNNIDLTNSILINVKSGNIKGIPKLSDRYKFINGYIIGSDVDLHNIDLSNQELYNIDLNNLDLSRCILKGLKSGNITGTPRLPDNYCIQNGQIFGPDVNLTGSDLSNQNLIGINLENAILSGIKSANVKGKPLLPSGYVFINNNIIGFDVDLTGADLQYIDLNDIDMSNCILVNVKSNHTKGNPKLPNGYKLINGYILGPRVNITTLNISDIDLTGIDLKGVLLQGAIFSNVNLTNANFINADLNNSSLYDCILENANFTGANLNEIKTNNLSGDPVLPKDYQLINKIIIGPNVVLEESDLDGVDLTNSILKGITSNFIKGTPLLPFGYRIINNIIVGPSVNLNNADLRGHDLSDINLSECNLSLANLTDAKLMNVISGNIIGIPILSTNYRITNGYIIGPNVNLENANLQNIVLKDAIINNANLTGADFSESNLTNIELRNVNLSGTNFKSAKLSNIITENIKGNPILPDNYYMINGYILGKNINIDVVNMDGVDLTGYKINKLNLLKIEGKPILPNSYTLRDGYLIGPHVKLNNINLEGFDFSDLDLTGVDLTQNSLKNVKSSNIIGNPILPHNYKLINKCIIGPNVDISNNDLKGADLTNIDLSGANLTNTDLRDTNLTNIISKNIVGNPILPKGYRLINQNIIGPNMELNNIDLSNIDMNGINFKNTKLVNVNLNKTLFNDTEIKGIYTLNITGEPVLPKGYHMLNKHIVGPYINLTNADLRSIDFKDIDLRNCILTNADFTDAKLKGVISGDITIDNNMNLEPKLPKGFKLVNGYIVGSGVNLEKASLKNINLKDISLEDSILTEADMMSANFKGFKSKGNIIGKPHLSNQYKFNKGYILGQHIDLSNNDFTDFDLSNIDLSYADFSGSILNNVNLTGANLDNCILKNIKSQNIIGSPLLPKGYIIKKGYIIGPHIEYVAINDYIIGPNVDLQGAMLSNLDLSGYDFTGCNFNGADLTNTRFSNQGVEITVSDKLGSFFYEMLSTNSNVILSNYMDKFETKTPMMNGHYTYINNLYQLRLIDIQTYTMNNIRREDWIKYKISNIILDSFKKLKSKGFLCWMLEDRNSNSLYRVIMMVNKNNTSSNIYFDNSKDMLEGDNFFHGFEISINKSMYIALEYNNIKISIKKDAVLDGVISGNIKGNPILPDNYKLKNGYIIGPNVKLNNINLDGINLNDTNLSGVDMSNSSLKNIKSGKIKGEPKMPDNYVLIKGYIIGPYVNLEDTELSHMNLTNMNLIGVNFSNANLNSTDFTNTILGETKFVGANLNQAKLKNIDLTRCDFTNANLTKTDLSASILNNAILIKANITDTNFTHCKFDYLISENVSGLSTQLPDKYSIVLGYIIGPNIKIVLNSVQKKNIIKKLDSINVSLVDIFKMESFNFKYGDFKDIEKELNKDSYSQLQEFLKKDKNCKKNFFGKTNRNCYIENGIIFNGSEDFKGGSNKKHSIRKMNKRINSKKKLLI